MTNCDACGLLIHEAVRAGQDAWVGALDFDAPCLGTTNGKHYHLGDSDPGWADPQPANYDGILTPTNQETDMDNDQPTTDAETPEFQAFQKRDEVARMISQAVSDEIEDELTAEQVNDISLAAAEMLLSNYFMRAVER